MQKNVAINTSIITTFAKRCNMQHYVLDEQDKPIPINDLFKWATFMQISVKPINHTMVDNNIIIITHFIGVDFDFKKKGKPILWQTMIFDGKHDQYQERYTSKEDALEGHKRAVKMVKNKK